LEMGTPLSDGKPEGIPKVSDGLGRTTGIRGVRRTGEVPSCKHPSTGGDAASGSRSDSPILAAQWRRSPADPGDGGQAL
jgi:hypothetical protein